MRKRHLAAFTDLETQRDQINAKLAGLAKETCEQGGDPPCWTPSRFLGDVLSELPNRIKQQLFEAFDLAMLYHKKDNQITCWATITPSTPATLAAIIAQAGTRDLAAYLSSQDHPSDLSRQPGTTRSP